MGLIWDVGLTTRGYKSFYTNLFGYPEQYVTLRKKYHAFFCWQAQLGPYGSVRDCWSAKMPLSAVTVGQVRAVLCSKLSLSTAYPSKSNKSYKLVLRLWTLYAAKQGLPTAWFTLPWFYTVFEFSGAALDLQQCEWEESQLWETSSGFLTLRFSWVLRKNCINQASCLSL